MAYTIALDIDAIIQKVLQYPVSFDTVILQNKIRQVLSPSGEKAPSFREGSIHTKY